MAKKKVVDEEVKPFCVVSDQKGNEVQTFDNVEEAYKFASENGYQVTIS